MSAALRRLRVFFALALVFLVVAPVVPVFAADGEECVGAGGVCVDKNVFSPDDFGNPNINLGPRDCNYGGRKDQLCRKDLLKTLSGWGSGISDTASSVTTGLKNEAQRNADALGGALSAFGNAVGGYDNKTLGDPLNGADFVTVIGRVVKAFLGTVGALSLLVFVYAGVTYMTAGGDSKRIQKSVDTMKYALIGLAIIVFAYAIASFYFQTLIGTAS